jgi:hypothetical protein
VIASSIVEAYLAGESVHGIARRLNTSDERVRRILVNRGVSLRTPREARLLWLGKGDAPPRYLPTPEQIALETARIRESWSSEERTTRKVFPRSRHSTPREYDTSKRLNGHAIPSVQR